MMVRITALFLLVLCSLASQASVLFTDDFNRADNPNVGNGWGEFSILPNGSPGPDMLTIASNQLRVTHSNSGQNRDAGISRPFNYMCGIVISGNAEWLNGPRNAVTIHVNGNPNFNPGGLLFGMTPRYRFPALPQLLQIGSSDGLNVSTPFTFDLSMPYEFEWIINNDCSSEARVWHVGTPKPTAPSLSSPAVTLTPLVNPHLVVQGSGGAGCCAYLPFDVRIDDLLVTQLTTIVADAGPDQSEDEGLVVALDGGASTGAVNFAWTQIAGPSVALSDPSVINPSFVMPFVPSNTTLTFQLIVDDGDGGFSDPDTVDVTVIDTNSPPVADAGNDATIKEGAVATLDGSLSFDPEGDAPLGYSWTQVAGPLVILQPSNTAVNPTFTAPLGVGNVLSFDLFVDDGKETGTPDSVTITVVENTQPVADAGPDQTIAEGSFVSLDGTASFDADGGDSLSFDWTEPFALDDDSIATPSFMAPLVGPGGIDFEFDLVVSDDDPVNPKSSAPDRVTIHVSNVNDPPSCDLARASCPTSKIKNNNGCTLWPPNHKLIDVAIEGVTDADSTFNDVTLTITGVVQDEPVNGLGDGDSSPDAVVQGGGQFDSVLIRAERQGGGNGRVYTVNFTADDGFESCSGSAKVFAPYSRKDTAVEDGQVYDSTQP